MSNKKKEEKKENKVLKLDGTTSIKFKAEKLKDKDDKQIYRKKEEGGEVVDDLDSPDFSRNDLESMVIFLRAVDLHKLSLDDERRHCQVLEKVKERWKTENWNCTIQFSRGEAGFLEKFLKDVGKYVKEVPVGDGSKREKLGFTQYHSLTKFAILDQLEDKG